MQNLAMNPRKTIDAITPDSGLNHLLNDYGRWSGISFFCFFIADGYDHLETAAYAAYYSEAAQYAINPHFWVLLSVVSLTLLCLILPIVYFARTHAKLTQYADLSRLAVRQFFTAAFTVGALLTGLMIAYWLHGHENAALIAAPWSGANETTFISIATLIVCNTLLGLLGESLCHQTDYGYSGMIERLIDTPLRVALPAYFGIIVVVDLIITAQQ